MVKMSSRNNKNNKNKNRNKKKQKVDVLQRGLKIGCINVRGLVTNPTKRIDLYNWIMLHELDIICIQEWYVHNSKIVNKNQHQWEGSDDDDNNIDITMNMSIFNEFEKIEIDNKTLILYRKGLEIINLNHIDQIDQTGLDVTWIGVKTHRKIIVIGSGYHSPSHNAQYDEILQQRRRIQRELNHYKMKVIFMLCGDFNSKHTIWGSSTIDKRGENMLDWIHQNKMAILNNGEYTYKNANGKKDVLDLMMIDSDFEFIIHSWSAHTIKSTRTKKSVKGTTWVPFSDHRGMIAVVSVDPIIDSKPNRITWNFDERKREKFRETMKIKMKEWNEMYQKLKHDKSSVNILTEYFQLLITTTAKEILGFKKFNDRSANWVNKDIQILLKEKNKLKNKKAHILGKMKKHFKSVANAPKTMKKQLKQIKHKYNKINKKLKKQKYKNILKKTQQLEKLINDPNVDNEKLFYDALDKISNNKSKNIPPIRDPSSDKIIATTDMEIADTLHKYYCKPLKRNEYEPKHVAFHRHVSRWMKNYQKNKNQSDSIVNRPYTTQEVLHALNNVNKHSAMAFDLMHYQLLLWCKNEIIINLTNLFNLCYVDHQMCPKLWKYGEYVPVPKPGRVPYYCSNIRPIMIIPIMGRLIGKVNCNRILTDCIRRKILSKNNCAFQCNKGPQDIVNAVIEKLYQAFQNGHFLELVFLDLKAAYDSVWIDGLLYRMVHEYKYDGNLIAWYIEYLKGRLTRVRHKNWVTKWRKPMENLLQGQTDSTILFDLMLNYIDLSDVDKIIRDLKIEIENENDKIDKYLEKKRFEMEMSKIDKNNKNNNNNNCEIEMKEEEKAEILDVITTRGELIHNNKNNNNNNVENNKDNNNTNINNNNNNQNSETELDIKNKIIIDWDKLNPNRINDDDDTLKIAKFQSELKNFADDCTLEMKPMLNKCQLNKMIKYGYRLNLQYGAHQFYNWIRYYKLVMAHTKCNTVTFSRKKQQFHAYVYKMDGNKMELIHSHSNGPQKCKHNERLSYINPLDKKEEDNGDSDLDNLDNKGNKKTTNWDFRARNPKNPIYTIAKKGKHAKRQKQSINKLPPNVRILGVFFDPELYFDEHIKIVMGKAQKKMNALLRLAFCKHYHFNPFAIYKLFETVIRPRVEYALCSVSVSKRMDMIIKLQKKAIRIALQAKKNTSSFLLNEITNTKTVMQKLKEQQIKMWNKYIRAPETMLQHHTFERWREYIYSNDFNSKRENGDLEMNPGVMNYVSKSPLSRCFATMREIYPNKNLMKKKKDSVVKPPPTYAIQFPTNIHTITDQKYIEIIKNKLNSKTFYCDGSCIPNPGPGGAGYYSPDFCIKSKIEVVDHDTTINYCELIGVKMILLSVKRFIEFCENENRVTDIDCINIYTDSNFVMNILNENGYPKVEYYYDLIQLIFKISSDLDKHGIHINILKVQSHIGNEGNEMADKLAKEAANIAKSCKYGESKFIKYDMRKNHVTVDIAKDLIRFRINEKEKRKLEWLQVKMQRLNKNKDRYRGNGIFEKVMIDNCNNVNNRTNDMKDELKYLTQNECEIITKLRTEMINLNDYLHYIKKHVDGDCAHCNVKETVEHYMMDCPGFTNIIIQQLHRNNVNYNVVRNKLRKDLRKIDVFFKNEINFNTMNILFPHVWQRKLTNVKRNEQQQIEWKQKRLRKRVDILKAVANFVRNTKRFNNDYGI